MKKTFTILLLALTMIGCSSNDDIADNSNHNYWKMDS